MSHSSTVYGVLMNHPGALAALDVAMHRPPYNAPPQAPVLYIKPRNTRIGVGGAPAIPAECGEVWVETSLGIVIGRGGTIAGWCVVIDLSMPHTNFYRPSARWRARDASLAVGVGVPRRSIGNPDDLSVEVRIDGVVVQRSRTSGRVRNVADLLADVSEFMTPAPGDVLMLGPVPDAPLLHVGQRASVFIDGLEPLELLPATAEAVSN